MKKHRVTDHPLYSTWTSLNHRCKSPNNKAYKYYGGKGIKVCDRWQGKDGFQNFYWDMGDKPSKKHSIDRIDVNGNYEPSNCRWATWHTQASNKTNSTGHTGVGWSTVKGMWCASLVVKSRIVVQEFYYLFEDALEARIEAEKKYITD